MGIQNIDIRLEISDAGIKHQDVARAIGISKETLSRWMSKPLTPLQRARVLYAIECLKERRDQDG